MANKEKLPWDLVEEILSRVPPKPLVRFRIVCKRWNALFDDKAFINNHKSTFRFIFATKSKIYAVSVNPKIEVRELTLDIPGLESENPKSLMECNGLLLCGMGEGAVVWNPWLKQTKWIEPQVNQPSLHFSGIGYDNSSVADDEIVYKTLAVYRKDFGYAGKCKIHDFASDEWEDQLQEAKRITQYRSSTLVNLHSKESGVSLHGTLYWVTYYLNSYDKTDHDPLFFLISFNFSSKRFLKFCDLPCVENDHGDALVLRVFKGDRFSLLKQCHVTKKIEIWVTKNKIRKSGGEDVEWISFMEVSVPNLPDLVPTGSSYQPSYYIDNKRLVVCSCDETGRAWIYVMGENKLISKIQLESVVGQWPLHCTYFPSLIPISGVKFQKGEEEEEEEPGLQVNFSCVWLLDWLLRKLKSFFAFLAK